MIEAITGSLKSGLEAAAALTAAAAIYLKTSSSVVGEYSADNQPTLRPFWAGIAIAITAGTVSAFLLQAGIFEREFF